MSLQRNWKWVLLVPFFLLAGCAPTTYEINREGFWGGLVVGPLSDLLDFLSRLLFDEYGLAILVITIIVRLIILPLSIKQYRSSRKMQELQPELMKIREKYATDPQKQQEETMKLFQQHNVNPMSGCLPLLIQMPVLIALYQSIFGNPHIREHTFLWMQLGSPDPWYILPVLAALTTFIQQKVSMNMMGQKQMPQMQMMLVIFPILIFVMSLSFPSALVLYWFYSNTFSIFQTYFMYKPRMKGEAVANVETSPHGNSGSNKKQKSGQRKNSKRRHK